MAAKKAKQETSARWLLVDRGGKEFKVLVPEGGRVTFGPAIPGPRGGNNFGDRSMEYALRIYGPSGEKDLRAVFTGVREFRDMEIEHAVCIEKEAGKTLWKSDKNGYEVSTSVQKEREWLALDAPKL